MKDARVDFVLMHVCKEEIEVCTVTVDTVM